MARNKPEPTNDEEYYVIPIVEGLNYSNVPFGYLNPDYPKAPEGAPSTWHPPRMPARPDPVTFPALVSIGELALRGWMDQAIADELEGY